MDVVEVRQLLQFNPKELLEGLKTDLNIEFEDGVIKTLPYKEIIILRYFMQLHSMYPEIKITSKYVLSNLYTNGLFTGKALSSWCEIFLEDFIVNVVKPKQNRDLLIPVYKELWNIFNTVYNEVIYSKNEYAGSLNIEDLLEIQMDDRLLQSMRDVSNKQTPESVDNTYKVLDDIIRNKEEIKNNQIVKGYISKSLNVNQVKQLLASRGYVTEIDNHIFKYPIASSYTLGMQTIYDMAIESRSGAKALFVSNKAIQTSEYFARELQLVTMIVEKLVDGDCGTTEYMDWYMDPGLNGKKADIDNMLGIEFINPETGKKDNLRLEHAPIVNGKRIKIRTALQCKHKDPRCVCTACFGDLSYAIPSTQTNIGQYCSTEMTEQASQGILSTKHLVNSASSADIALCKIGERFFTIKKGTMYAFKPTLASTIGEYKLVIDQESGFGIKDLNPSVDVNKLNPQRVSRIESIFIVHTDKNGNVEKWPITIKEGNKFGYFTLEFLDYIIKNSFTLDNMDNYTIDLKGWDVKHPIIAMPDIEYDFLTLVNQINSMFKHMETNTIGIGFETPESLLQKLFDKVNYKLNMNLAMLALIVYAFTVKDPDKGDFSLGRNVKNPKLAKLGAIIKNRSLGAAYGWEEVPNTVLSPRSFNGNNAVEHPMDVLFAPNEVISKHYNKK